jgi:hypothetical protein
MNNNNQAVTEEQTLPDGLLLTVGEMADGQFGWWIDAPGSELRSIVVDNRTGHFGFKPIAPLTHGEQPTRDAAIAAGKKAWQDRYGS